MEKSKKDKKKYSGFVGDCSEEQLEALQKFRQIVTTANDGITNLQWDDEYLLRFLRARKFNLKETEKMWVQFIKWRKKNNIDSLTFSFYFPQLGQLRKIYPHGFHKYDKKFRPIYIQRVGKTHPEDIFKLTNEQTLLQYYAMSYETLLSTIFQACTKQKHLETGDSSRVLQTCTILDLKDIKLSNTSSAYKFAKPATEMAQNNYPEILGSMFVINAPFLFTGVWAVVKMWLDDKTKEKIQILGSSYKKQLLKHIDPENLPDFLEGGKCRCPGGDCLALNVGPWNPEGSELFPQCFKELKGSGLLKKEQKQEEEAKAQKKGQEEEEEKEEKMLLIGEGVRIHEDVLKFGLMEEASESKDAVPSKPTSTQ